MRTLEIKRPKIFTAGIVAVILVAFLIGLNLQTISTSILSLGAKPVTNVQWIFECYEGTYVYDEHNLITDKGEQLSRDWGSQGLDMNTTKLVVGNMTGLDQTDTVITEAYADPTDGTYIEATVSEWSNSGDSAGNFTFQWTFEETVQLNASALYFGNTTFAYAIANFPSGDQGFSNGENLTCTWTITYNAN